MDFKIGCFKQLFIYFKSFKKLMGAP